MFSLEAYGKGLLTIFSAIIGVAILSVILSKDSDTPGIIQSLGSSLSRVVAAAVKPLPGRGSSASTTKSVAPDLSNFLSSYTSVNPLW